MAERVHERFELHLSHGSELPWSIQSSNNIISPGSEKQPMFQYGIFTFLHISLLCHLDCFTFFFFFFNQFLQSSLFCSQVMKKAKEQQYPEKKKQLNTHNHHETSHCDILSLMQQSRCTIFSYNIQETAWIQNCAFVSPHRKLFHFP